MEYTENIKCWLRSMIEKEIDEVKVDISNEHIWENGYNEEGVNPHTENIIEKNDYLTILEHLIDEYCEN